MGAAIYWGAPTGVPQGYTPPTTTSKEADNMTYLLKQSDAEKEVRDLTEGTSSIINGQNRFLSPRVSWRKREQNTTLVKGRFLPWYLSVKLDTIRGRVLNPPRAINFNEEAQWKVRKLDDLFHQRATIANILLFTGSFRSWTAQKFCPPDHSLFVQNFHKRATHWDFNTWLQEYNEPIRCLLPRPQRQLENPDWTMKIRHNGSMSYSSSIYWTEIHPGSLLQK